MFDKVRRVNWGQLEEACGGLEGWTDNCLGQTLCRLCEISISSDQYSKSKTARVKKSYSSSLKKKSILFFFPYTANYSQDYIWVNVTQTFQITMLSWILYHSYFAPTVSSPPLFSLKMRKANKPEPSITQFSSPVLQISTNLHKGLWPWKLVFWRISLSSYNQVFRANIFYIIICFSFDFVIVVTIGVD